MPAVPAPGKGDAVESSRVVEVIHDQGESASPRWLLGSGFIVRANVVVTAAHNLGESDSSSSPSSTVIRTIEGSEHVVAAILARDNGIDLAVLAVPDLPADAVTMARVDRSQIELLREVTAVGFPNYKYASTRPVYQRRQPAQPTGTVPTIENFSTGNLVLKLESGLPNTLPSGSPWEGMSGAGVFIGDALLGIVIEHHPGDGLGALHFVPLTSIESLTSTSGAVFCAVLNVASWVPLDAVHSASNTHAINPALMQDLKEIQQLLNQGLLEAPDAKTLRIVAMKKFKGWG
jgi:hypothetical protein